MKRETRRWGARFGLALVFAAVCFALYLPRGHTSIWPLPGDHPHILPALLVVAIYVALGLAVLIALALLVVKLWEWAR